MAKVEEGYLYIYYKDIKKPTQKKIVEYLTSVGVEKENIEAITENDLPVIVIGFSDESSDTTDLDGMVS